MITREEALKYHSEQGPGKLEIRPTKPCSSQRDLALAYSPGVAEPCREIVKNPQDVYRYTSKGNLVGVITNGTAVLGLGDIGAEASKPVMEGKAVLFKKFAGIDVFDIEIQERDPKQFIEIVKSLAPTFGGINLEDIKAPECFNIETELDEGLDIPVFHDDQHGTAIICGAALINSLEIIGKKIEDIKVVFSGAGAAAIACAKMFENLGVQHQNIFMVDRKGVIHQDRENLEKHRAYFSQQTSARTLADALVDADCFIGLSSQGLVSPDMLQTMAKDALVFALANPDPEIEYDLALKTRPDIIMATGRSDHPNQVNNVLGFPAIFRAALDIGAKKVSDRMKMACAQALAGLAKLEVPHFVCDMYLQDKIEYGSKYIIPKALDPRVVPYVARRIAEAAIQEGIATRPIQDLDQYEKTLEKQFLASFY